MGACTESTAQRTLVELRAVASGDVGLGRQDTDCAPQCRRSQGAMGGADPPALIGVGRFEHSPMLWLADSIMALQHRVSMPAFGNIEGCPLPNSKGCEHSGYSSPWALIASVAACTAGMTTCISASRNLTRTAYLCVLRLACIAMRSSPIWMHVCDVRVPQRQEQLNRM